MHAKQPTLKQKIVKEVTKKEETKAKIPDEIQNPGSLWQFKTDEQNMNYGNPPNVTTADSSSFKYKSSCFKLLIATDNGVCI